MKDIECGKYRLTDLAVILLAALFCWCALQGTLELNPQGIGMDSDLQNYAQIMEAAEYPAAFALDPVASYFPRDPGVPNLLTDLAGLFPGGDNAAVDMLRVGSLGVFLHFLAYYILGRCLFRSPFLAVLLSILMGIAVHWAFGTFWGSMRSDPVPRIFYADLWPFLLLLACAAVKRPLLQPVVMLLSGCAMLVHTVSALMGGAMFFMAFFLLWQGRRPWRHAGLSLLNLLSFAIPVAIYLRVFLADTPAPPVEYGGLFAEVRALRYSKDWHDVWQSLADIVRYYIFPVPLFPAAAVSAVVLFKKRQQLAGPVRTLLRLMPGMVLGIAGGCVLCALEMWLARHLGRQNMSQEILRGTRFLVPLSWLLLTCLFSLYWQGIAPLLRRGFVVLLAVVLLSLGQGKQVVAARHALADMTGMSWLDTAEARQLKVRSLRLQDALRALRAQAGPEEIVFTDGNCMAVRFAARMPLLPVHKDGNVIYYAGDPVLARRWLAMQQCMAADAGGYMDIWRTEQAALLLTRHVEHKAQLLRYGSLLFENEDWLLLRRSPVSTDDGAQATRRGHAD